MSKKVTRKKKPAVTVTDSNNGGFGSGYISYVKKDGREHHSKKGTLTPYILYIYNYYYYYLFNVTNVTLLLTLAIIDVIGLRYNVTYCNFLGG